MLPGDSAVVTGDLMLAPTIMEESERLELGELVQIIEIDDFVQAALVWGADSGARQWIALESLTPLGVLFGGFVEGVFDE
jgi:hypothetical protein|tara:strand:+ start:178 stop:417 length:240 start_codon:yes stop_codon:yes gene_type:complete